MRHSAVGFLGRVFLSEDDEDSALAFEPEFLPEAPLSRCSYCFLLSRILIDRKLAKLIFRKNRIEGLRMIAGGNTEVLHEVIASNAPT